MLDNMSPLFKTIIDNFDKIDDFTKYCLSDKIETNLSDVIDKKYTPLYYATTVAEKSCKKIARDFFSGELSFLKTKPVEIQQLWVYEKAVEAACKIRLLQVRPFDVETIDDIAETSLSFLTIIDRLDSSISYLGGLANFKKSASKLLDRNRIFEQADYIGRTRRLIEVINDIDNTKWIFNKPLWYKTIADDNDTLHIFRSFLYTVVIVSISHDNFCEGGFGISKKDFFNIADELVFLIEDETTTRRDILNFIDKIEQFEGFVNGHSLFSPLIVGTDHSFKETHHHLFPDIKTHDDIAIKDNALDRPIWALMRSLGEEYDLDNILFEDEVTPYHIVSEIMQDHYETIYFSKPFKDWCQSNIIHLPDKIPSYRKVISAAMTDFLYISVIERRVLAMTNNDNVVTQQLIQSQRQLLLIFNDEDYYRLGLSIVLPILSYHLGLGQDNLNEYEYTTICNLMDAWARRRYDRPNKQNDNWSSIFKQDKFNDQVRSLFYSVCEAIHIKDEESFQESFSMSKVDYYRFIDNFQDILRENASLEEVIDYLDNKPMPSLSILTGEDDVEIWTLCQGDLGTDEDDE